MAELTFMVEGTVTGTFRPDEALLEVVGDALEAHPAVVDPVLAADATSGALHVSVEVAAADAAGAISAFRAALDTAMRAASQQAWAIDPAPALIG